MIRRAGTLVLVVGLGGCVSVHQTPLPSNRCVAELYPRSAQGDTPARLLLAQCYRVGGDGVGKNEAESLRLWLDAAEAGNAQAQLALAGHYHTMLDRERAAYWYLRQARLGNKFAASGLARLAADSRSAGADLAEALKWAYVAEEPGRIEQYQKSLTVDEVAAARHAADDWNLKVRTGKDTR